MLTLLRPGRGGLLADELRRVLEPGRDSIEPEAIYRAWFTGKCGTATNAHDREMELRRAVRTAIRHGWLIEEHKEHGVTFAVR